MLKRLLSLTIGFLLGVWAVTTLALVVLLIVGAAHGEVNHHSHNSLGAVVYESRPYVYLMGSAIDGEVIAEGKATVLRIQPSYTYNLYDESILLCGDQSSRLSGTGQPMILTYDKTAHRKVEGVACFDLVGIDEVKPKKVTGE